VNGQCTTPNDRQPETYDSPQLVGIGISNRNSIFNSWTKWRFNFYTCRSFSASKSNNMSLARCQHIATIHVSDTMQIEQAQGLEQWAAISY